MIKKILIFVSVLAFVVGYSFADNITNDLTGAISGDQTDFVLDNGPSIISIENTDNDAGDINPYIFNFKTGDNDFLSSLTGDISNLHENISIICKNGYIIEITNITHTWSGETNPQESAKLFHVNTKVSPPLTGNIILTCNPIAQPTKKFEETNIDYQTIKQKLAFGNIFPVTANKISIETSDIEKFKSNKNIDNQPAFINIVYLQFEIIWNLSDSLINTKPHFDFSKLFKTTSDTGYNFTGYNIWLSKFGRYSTKKEFIDAMSGAITLKDIGVAQDVINGLYDCANNNNCSKVIQFQHNILDTYDPYSLEEIQNILYLNNSDNILDKSISYYNYLSGACNNLSSIQDTFLRNQTQNIYDEILKQNVDDNDELNFENYKLGYGLGERVKNLNALKTNFKSLGTGANLLGIYNIYYELTYLNIGVDKLSYIKKATEESDTNNQYKTIRKIFENEKKDIQNKKLVKDDDQKIVAKKRALEKVFTPGTVLNNVVKNLPNFNSYTSIDVKKVCGNDIININGTPLGDM